jgi:hypothetical protein
MTHLSCRFFCIFTLVLIFIGGCAAKTSLKEEQPDHTTPPILQPQHVALLSDLTFNNPQLVCAAVPLSNNPLLEESEQQRLYFQALKHFFAPWKMTQTSFTTEQAFWGVRGLGSKQGYAENLQPYPRDRWERIVALQNMSAFPSLAQAGIVTRNTALRVLPSLRPFFLDPSKPGEGFPFDHFQASALWLGTPVLICHISTDKAWYFVETAFASGWVRVEDIALAQKEFCTDYESQNMAAILLDETSFLSGNRLLGQTHIGAIFPLVHQKNNMFTIKVPTQNSSGQAHINLVGLNVLQAAPMPLSMTSKNIAMLADAMSGQLYGWGGMFENRDCSSTMRDLFLPFGIWLPRNSAYQAQKGGKFISLEGLNPEQKLATIHNQGRPLASLLWLPGHIGLYLGADRHKEPLILHNMWGVRTIGADGREGRVIAGKLVISTLRPGENRADVQKDSFLGRIRGLTLLGKHN